VLAIRHGETAWNVDTRIQGHLDIPLNDTGRWQARQVAIALADERIDAIYSSDLLRAYQTAQAVATRNSAGDGGSGGDGRAAGVADGDERLITTDIGLRERSFGIFEGLTHRQIQQRWPEQDERWRRRDPDFGAEGGETLRDFYARCVTTATRLAAAHPGQTIALVAHGGVMDCLYRAASGVGLEAPRSWQLGNASINRVLYSPQGFTLVGWSDTHHLEGGGRDSPLDEFSDGVTARAT